MSQMRGKYVALWPLCRIEAGNLYTHMCDDWLCSRS